MEPNDKGTQEVQEATEEVTQQPEAQGNTAPEAEQPDDAKDSAD